MPAAVAALLAAGCGSGEPTPAADCLPPPLGIEPAAVRAGGDVTLSSGPSTCGVTYPRGATFDISLLDLDAGVTVDLGSVPVGSDGSFSARLGVPTDAPTGAGWLAVEGSRLPACGDGGAGCGGYGVDVEVLPAP